jgi:hypothetical protein
VDILSKADIFSEEKPQPEVGEIVESGNQEIRIFVTEEDIRGNDPTKMSNFFELRIRQLTRELATTNSNNILENIPLADLSMINEVIHYANELKIGEFRYVPNFDSLPQDVKKKLKEKIYKIGESKQVDGDMRAVILDENNTRVKDITLKLEKINSDSMERIRNISIQAQLKQIYEKLDAIQELQNYQIDRDRDRDIVNPFITAKKYILRAQEGGTQDYKRENLKKATDEITKAISAISTDLGTTSNHLFELIKKPIFQKTKMIEKFIGYMILDLKLFTIYIGVQLQVFDYLNDKVSAKLTLDDYQYLMQDFFDMNINQQKKSAVKVIHEYYNYNKNNVNFWYELGMEVNSVMHANLKSLEGKDGYLTPVLEVKEGVERSNLKKVCRICKKTLVSESIPDLCPRCLNIYGSGAVGALGATAVTFAKPLVTKFGGTAIKGVIKIIKH